MVIYKGGVYEDENGLHIKEDSRWFGSLSETEEYPEIILTKQEAKERGINLDNNPDGFFIEIGYRKVPITII